MRRDDIPNLLRHFLARFCAEENRLIKGISGEAMAGLSQLDWPGNIRQLENAVYRAVVMSEDAYLGPSDFSSIGLQPTTGIHPGPQAEADELLMEPVPQRTAQDVIPGNQIPLAPMPDAGSLPLFTQGGEMRPLEELEADIIRFAISHYRGQMSEVARQLKIGRSTLYRKLDDVAAKDDIAAKAEQ
jgi:DNA-binding NtrC family response regulator